MEFLRFGCLAEECLRHATLTNSHDSEQLRVSVDTLRYGKARTKSSTQVHNVGIMLESLNTEEFR